MALKFTGLPAGERVELNVTNDGVTKSGVARRWGMFDPLHTLQAAPSETFGVSVTVDKPQPAITSAFPPQGRFHSEIVQQIDGRRIQVDLDNANVLRDVAWVGATVEAYRVSSGERSLVGTFTITGANFGEWQRATDDDDVAHDATGFSHRHNSFGKSDDLWEMRERWFGVAAVDSSNQIGAIGSVGYTPTSLATGDNPANSNTVDLSSNYTTGGSLAAPAMIMATADISGPATANVTHGAVVGAIGYMHFLTWDDPATHPTFKYIEVDGDGIQVGDQIVVRQRFLDHNPDYLATRTMGLSDGTHGGRQIAPANSGLRGSLYAYRGKIDASMIQYDGSSGFDWAMRFQISATADQTATILLRDYWNDGPDQSFYHVVSIGQTYRVFFEVFVDRPVDIVIQTGLVNLPDVTRSLQTGWNTVEIDQVATTQASRAEDLQVRYTPDGSPLDIRFAGERIQVGTADQSAGFRSDIAARLPAGMLVRDHTFIKVLAGGYFIEDIIAPAHAGTKGYSLHQFLASCVTSQCEPWLQIEPFLNPTEWDWFADYLCAPVSSGRAGALRRQELGRADPWVDAFTYLRLEFGNEAWNGLSEFYNPAAPRDDSVTSDTYNGGRCFGIDSRHAAQTLMANTYWSSKIGFTLGGRSSQPSYSGDALRGFRLPCHVGIANYNGGWDVGGNLVIEDDASYQNTLSSTAANQIERMDNLVAELQTVCTDIGLTYQAQVRPTCYEAGPGYQLDGLNGASLTEEQEIVQEVVMKSRVTGTATLHTALAQAARGFAHFNFFLIGRGDRWASHASDAQGGATYPPWQTIRKLHEEFGTMRVSEATYQYDDEITVQANDGGNVTVDTTFCFGLTSDTYSGKDGFAIGNIDRSEPAYVNVSMSAGGAITGHLLLGDYDEHNRYPVGQRLTDQGTFVADANSVAISLTQTALPALSGQIPSNGSLGFGADGIEPGNFGIFTRG